MGNHEPHEGKRNRTASTLDHTVVDRALTPGPSPMLLSTAGGRGEEFGPHRGGPGPHPRPGLIESSKLLPGLGLRLQRVWLLLPGT